MPKKLHHDGKSPCLHLSGRPLVTAAKGVPRRRGGVSVRGRGALSNASVSWSKFTFSVNAKHGDNPLVAAVETIEKTPKFSFKPSISLVNCCVEKTYENERRELFQPNTEQIKDVRAWLVRAVARRAVEILKASENPR